MKPAVCRMRRDRVGPGELRESKRGAALPIPRGGTRGAPGAFTLLELLVAIAVIAILAALLLPAINRGKSAAQGVRCTSNLRQLIQAWHIYADENNGQLPCNADGQDGMGVFTNWVAGTMSRSTDATNAQLLIDPRESALARYITAPGVYKCPGDRSRFVRSVSMNCRMNPTRIKETPAFMQGGGSPYEIFRKTQGIRQPESIFVFLDGTGSEQLILKARCIAKS